MEKHYTLLKAAELLGVTTQTLRNWDKAGKIYTIRTPGNQRRIPESEIARLMNPGAFEISREERKPKRSKGSRFLMCKDIAVYDIENSQILDENLIPGCMLKETMSFNQWMQTRYSTETNFSSQRLKQQTFDNYDHQHAAYTTGALSLSDCYWIKNEDDDLQFIDVSSYIKFNPLTNLFVSGKSDKRWIDAQNLLKVNSYGEIEPYYLFEALSLENTIEAQVTEEGIILSNFTSADIFFESMEQFGYLDESIDPRDLFIENFKERAVALFVVDYLIENNDRQADDYGFLRSSNTGEYMSIAPYFNFDWIWTGNSVPLSKTALQEYREYIHDLCRRAIRVASDFEYGTIIERRANELMRL